MPIHQPVLLKEVIDLLKLQPGMTVIDATIGAGGHSEKILQAIGPTGKLLGIDTDVAALRETKKRLGHHPNLTLAQAWFDELTTIASTHDFESVDGILFDLGISSLQLDDEARGLSFQRSGPLDMRLDQRLPKTAADIVKRATEKTLADIFYRYGELYDARRLARTLKETREHRSIERTDQLVAVLQLRNPGVKAKVFQALRIAVNDELGRLSRTIPQAVSILKPGGRIAIITFHSLEDRIVKQAFRANYLLEPVTKKPIVPTEEEIQTNSRSRSAKLRVAEKKVSSIT